MPRPEAAVELGPRTPPAAKRAMRAIWLRLPRSAATYKMAKCLTRTVLRPDPTPFLTEVRLGGGLTLHVDLSDIVGNDLYCMDDHYEARTLGVWRSLAREAGTILDLGSHIGLYACVAASVNRRARVVAVEAYAPNVRLLARNAAAFPNLTVVEAALGATGGRRVFRLSPITGGGYIEEPEPSVPRSTPGTRERRRDSVVVDTLTLAALCAQHAIGRVDLVKMDLEGLEQPLLTGQDDFWTRSAPRHVIVEVTLGRTGEAPRRLFAAMAKRGYGCRRLEGLHTFPWFRREDLANWHFWKTP